MNDAWSFFFPGQGSQKAGMGRVLYENFEVARRIYEEADEALGEPLSKLCFEGPNEALQPTANAQPAILTTSLAAFAVARDELGIEPALCLGHSLGEISALTAAGAISLADAVRLVRLRGQAMQDAVPVGIGGMVALLDFDPGEDGLEMANLVCESCRGGEVLGLANLNGGGQYVLSGHLGAIERVLAYAETNGLRAKQLHVSAPFHSPLMQPAAARLAAALEQIPARVPHWPVLSNVTADLYRSAGQVRELLVAQVTGSVRWESCVTKAIEMGIGHGVELGSKRVLCDLNKKITDAFQVRPLTNIRQLEKLAKERLEAPLAPVAIFPVPVRAPWPASNRHVKQVKLPLAG